MVPVGMKGNGVVLLALIKVVFLVVEECHGSGRSGGDIDNGGKGVGGVKRGVTIVVMMVVMVLGEDDGGDGLDADDCLGDGGG